MTSERTYPLAIHAWATYDDRITVKTATGEAIAHFPVPFIASGGDNTWRYVLGAVDQLVIPDCRHLGLIKDDAGQIVDLDGVPKRGTYVYEQNGRSISRWLMDWGRSSRCSRSLLVSALRITTHRLV
jgi:hypothetical protein